MPENDSTCCDCCNPCTCSPGNKSDTCTNDDCPCCMLTPIDTQTA